MSKQAPNPYSYYVRENQGQNQVHRQQYSTRQLGPGNVHPRASQAPQTMATNSGQAFTTSYPYQQYAPQPTYAPVMLQHASPMQVKGGPKRKPQHSRYMHQRYPPSYVQGPQAQAPQYYMGQMQQNAGMRPRPMTAMPMPGTGYVQQPASAAPQSYSVPIVAPQIDYGASYGYASSRDEQLMITQDTTFEMDDICDSGLQVQGDLLASSLGDVLEQAVDVTSLQPQAVDEALFSSIGSLTLGNVPVQPLSSASSSATPTAVGSTTSERDQSTVQLQQQVAPSGCEPVNSTPSNEPAVSARDATIEGTVPSHGSATGSAGAKPFKSREAAPKHRYTEAVAGLLAGQERSVEEIANLAIRTDPLLACCLCGRLMKDAVQLTCLHNCCECCFSASASTCNSGYVECNTCGDVTHSGAQQPNGFIEQQLQRYMAIAESRSCGACKENGEPDKPALMWCSACKHSLCGDCLPLHRQYKRSHVTQSLEDLDSLDEVCSQSATAACTIHGRPLEIACVNCTLAKCPSCLVECKRNNHEMHIAGEDSFENYIREFIDIISSEESALLQMARVLDSPKCLLRDLKTSRALHLEQIAQRKRRVADAVDVAYQQIECLTKNLYDDLEKEADDASEAAEDIAVKLSDARNYISRLLEANCSYQILNQQGIIRERLKLLSAEIDVLKNATDSIKAVKINSWLPDDLETTVQAWIGVLHTDSGRGPKRGLNKEGTASGGHGKLEHLLSHDKIQHCDEG